MRSSIRKRLTVAFIGLAIGPLLLEGLHGLARDRQQSILNV
jgi:hypothetical protein